MKPKYVIVCLLDAAGAKHMSCYGYDRKTTPNIDKVAAEGVIFRKCFSPADYTMSGCGSFHTGRYAEHHGAFYLERRLKDDDLTFAETMRRAGYTTAGWSANPFANSYMGFDIGFDYYENFPEDMEDKRKRGADDMSELEQEYHRQITKWLDEVDDKNAFAYIHFLPPHGDYETPPKFLYTWAKPEYAVPDTTGDTLMAWEQGKKPYTQNDIDYVRDLYDENMLYADYNVGIVIDQLKQRGMWDDTLFIVTADHGEAFMEHGFTLHNTTLYDEMIHIPLIMKLPKGDQPVRKDITAIVELIDIYPTVADMLSVTLPEGSVDGKSLLPLIDGEAIHVKEYTFSRSAHFITPILSVRTDKFKYVYNQMTGKRELYDLESDPLERIDVIAENQSLADEFQALLEPALEYYRAEVEKHLAKSNN